MLIIVEHCCPWSREVWRTRAAHARVFLVSLAIGGRPRCGVARGGELLKTFFIALGVAAWLESSTSFSSDRFFENSAHPSPSSAIRDLGNLARLAYSSTRRERKANR